MHLLLATSVLLLVSVVVRCESIKLTKDSHGPVEAQVGQLIEVDLCAFVEQGRGWEWSAPRYSGRGSVDVVCYQYISIGRYDYLVQEKLHQ